jgi:phage terminase large subunit
MAQKQVKAVVRELPAITANFVRPARTRVFKGGRGSGKTRGLAKRSAIRVYQLAEAGVEGVFLSSREFMNSLEESSMEEIKQAIKSEPWLNDYFEIGEKYIRTKNRRIDYVFAGLRHNLDSIKSKSRIIGNWTDEAENVSEVAWRKLTGTLREEGPGWVAENWVSYNPESPDSATHTRFAQNPPADCIVSTINWRDNLYFPTLSNLQRLEDKLLRPDTYEHVWEGAFLTMTEAQIFHGKFVVEDFTPQRTWDGPYQGGDFGFSQDPTAAVRLWIGDGCLWIEREAGKTGLELDDTGEYLTKRIPGFADTLTRWDNARPESISHLKRPKKHANDARVPLPRSESVEKWPGSIEDGIAFIRSFRRVVIHSRCQQTAREFRLYSYKIDRLTQEITSIIVDANNHYIDATRYALAPIIKNQGAFTSVNSGMY